MAIDLLNLVAHFKRADDRETNVAYHRTQVPWVAPLAYLHIIYKAAGPELLADVVERLRIPPAYAEFLQRHNGARLFCGLFNLYGIHAPGQLLSREPFGLLPLNIEAESGGMSGRATQFYVVGGYAYDGTAAVIDKNTGRVGVVPRDTPEPLLLWPSVEDWITSEVVRLSALFDEYGRLLTNEAHTVPRVEQIN